MNNEYGIACLLDECSANKLSELVPFLEPGFPPHVSLFQFKSTDNQFFSLISKHTENLFISNHFSTKSISTVENNIFLDIMDDSTLKTSSDKSAEFYFSYLKNKEPLSQIDISELDSDQFDLTKKYGIYWIKNYFRPHVTLLYNKLLDSHVKVRIPETICLLPPKIYPIDHLGRILI